MKRSEIIFGLLRIPVDYLATIFAFFAAYEIRTMESFWFLFGPPVGTIDPLNIYLMFASTAGVFLVGLFAFDGMYALKSTMTFRRECKKVLFLTCAWFMGLIAFFFIMRIQFFSRLILGYAFLLTIVSLVIGRIIIRLVQKYFLSRGYGKRRVMILGSGSLTSELQKLLKNESEYEVVSNVETNAMDMPNLEQHLRELRIDELIQTQSVKEENRSEKILQMCQLLHITYRFVPDLMDVQRTNIDLMFLKGIPIITLKDTPLDGWGRVLKRLFDVIISMLMLIILSPIFVIISILIKLDSHGSVLYRSRRVSTRGRTFFIYKFRSMVENAEAMKEDLRHLSHREGPLFKVKNDPRVTRFGAFLRSTSLDELPQLWNVFVGEMSLVGPRPHLPDEVARYEKHHRRVLSIKPGITGMSQVSGRSDLPFEDEVRLDIYYIENWSLWMDIMILIKTLPVVWRGRAAD